MLSTVPSASALSDTATGSAAIETMAARKENWSVSMVAFGHPSNPGTSSGYARNLTNALRAQQHVRREFSAKLVKPVDAFRGALALHRHDGKLSFSIRRAWMWSKRGSETLSRRLDAEIRRSGDRGVFLQVGTLVRIDPAVGPHLMRTDMTIAQARRAGRFAVSALPRRRLDAAEKLQREILGNASHVFAASQWTADSLTADCGVPPGKITVLYTGGNLTIPPGVQEERATREVLFVGIDWERKGGPLLLEAFRAVHARLPDATLRIVGCNPRGVNHPAVKIEGLLDKRDPAQAERLARCYLRASCFCLPAVFDPFPNVIIEAASVGLPSVAIDNGSRREAIIDSETGVLAKEATPAALAEALFAVLRDVDHSRRLGAAARERARRQFAWDLVVDKVGLIVNALSPPAGVPVGSCCNHGAAPAPCSQ